MVLLGRPAICWSARRRQQQQQLVLGLSQVQLAGAAITALVTLRQMMLMSGCRCSPLAAAAQLQLHGAAPAAAVAAMAARCSGGHQMRPVWAAAVKLGRGVRQALCCATAAAAKACSRGAAPCQGLLLRHRHLLHRQRPARSRCRLLQATPGLEALAAAAHGICAAMAAPSSWGLRCRQCGALCYSRCVALVVMLAVVHLLSQGWHWLCQWLRHGSLSGCCMMLLR